MYEILFKMALGSVGLMLLYIVFVLIPYDEYQKVRNNKLERAKDLIAHNPSSLEARELIEEISYMMRLKYKFLIIYYIGKFEENKRNVPEFLLNPSK